MYSDVEKPHLRLTPNTIIIIKVTLKPTRPTAIATALTDSSNNKNKAAATTPTAPSTPTPTGTYSRLAPTRLSGQANLGVIGPIRLRC